MKKIIKWFGLVLLILVIIVLAGSWIFSRKFMGEFSKIHSIATEPIVIPSDSASIERGRALSVMCRQCHGVDLGGKIFFDEPSIATLPSSNLTRAKGSETEGYTDLDYIRALRHGISKSGHVLMIMPSAEYMHFSDKDLGSLIAFINTLPPVDRKLARRKFTYMAKVMAGAGMFGKLFDYKKIDHDKAKHVAAIPMSNSLEYGEYVLKFSSCKICHGENLGGSPSTDPATPSVPDISPSGNIRKWTQEQFIQTFRTGTTPEGKVLNQEFMPFEGVGVLQDVEIEALYNFIKTFPPAIEDQSGK